MFFLRRKGAPQLATARVLGLKLSLNTPVVDTADLPVAPARAAILVHEEPDGRPNVTIGVRSLKNGEVAFYSYPGDLREETSTAAGASAALSFGEGMGFLFDEDEVCKGTDDERVQALGLWGDLMAPGAQAGPIADMKPVGEADLLGEEHPVDDDVLLDVDEGDALESGDEELAVLELLPDDEIVTEADLDRTDPGYVSAGPTLPPVEARAPEAGLPPAAREPLMAPEHTAQLALAEESVPPMPEPDAEIEAAALDCVVSPEAPETPEPALSKFRQRLPEPAHEEAAGQGTEPASEAAGTTGRQALGRVKLVKRRTAASEEERRKWLVRLLSAF